MNNDREENVMKMWLKRNWKKAAVWLIALDVFVYVAVPALLVLVYWIFGIQITMPELAK